MTWPDEPIPLVERLARRATLIREDLDSGGDGSLFLCSPAYARYTADLLEEAQRALTPAQEKAS